jgi:cellulose synthase/poly-beta-1,6-N-acetylglucosamine synthase-like glycosyltransferase
VFAGGSVTLLLVLFEVYRLGLRVLAALMGVHFLATSIGYLRRRGDVPTPADPSDWPLVTVQLPIRNEYYTATRLLAAVEAFDYPKQRLEIQILDDSNDGTSQLMALAVLRLRDRGFDVQHLARDVPTFFKAGALQAGLEHARGELVAMFDADFIPPPDFLRRVVPHFSEPDVAMVQGSWDHLNREQSWLTRLQGQLLDALFLVEQAVKSRAGLPFQFNGTAGVWRRAAVDEAGGWKFDSLTEDLDLSIRVQMLGRRMVHLPDLRVPSELPTTLAAFRVQQRRWALGTAQLLRKKLFGVLKSSMPLRARIAIGTQLGRHLVHPLVLLMVMSVPVTTLYWTETPIEYGWWNAALLAFLAGSIALQHAIGARLAGQSVLRAFVLAPLVVPLAIGLAPTYCAALWYGLRDRAGVFYRTPKVTRMPLPGEPEYRPTRSWLVIVECSVGISYAYFTAVAVERGLFQNAAFLALICVSYLWLGFGSLPTHTRSATTAPRLAIAEHARELVPAESNPGAAPAEPEVAVSRLDVPRAAHGPR